MPDLDRLPRGLRRGWRSAASAIQGKHDPDVVADAFEKALAKTLRTTGNMTWLPDLGGAVASARRHGSSEPIEEVIRRLPQNTVTGPSSAFLDAAWSLSQVDVTSSERQVSTETVVAQGLDRMIDKLCIGPVEPAVVPAKFASNRDFREYAAACKANVRLPELSRQLASVDFDGRRVRAPRSRVERPGTKALLNAPIT